MHESNRREVRGGYNFLKSILLCPKREVLTLERVI
jgi:hypothetical protein